MEGNSHSSLRRRAAAVAMGSYHGQPESPGALNHAAPAAANTNAITFGFRSNAGAGEGAAAVISATKGAGVDRARLEVSVGTGSGGTGAVVGRFDPTAAAGETRFWPYDEMDATLKRVKLGAEGSCAGGAGKCLYVDNWYQNDS